MFPLNILKKSTKANQGSARIAYKTLKEVIGTSGRHSVVAKKNIHDALLKVISDYTGMDKLQSSVDCLSLKSNLTDSDYALLNFQVLVPRGEAHKLKSLLH